MKKYDLSFIVGSLVVVGLVLLLMTVVIGLWYEPRLFVMKDSATYIALIGWGSIVCGLVLDCASKVPVFEKY